MWSSNTPPPPRRDAERGFALVESMLTMTTVMISALVLAVATTTIRVQSSGSKTKSRVVQNVKALMEQMGAVPISSLGTVFPHDTDIPEFNDRNVRDLRVRVVYRNGDPDALPLHYAVRATWSTDRGAPAVLIVHGIRAR